MIRMGFPHATEFSGIFFHTTLPAPIITLFPMEVFPKMIEPWPINTSSPIVIFPTLLYPNGLFVLASWAMSVEWVIVTLLPMVIRWLKHLSIKTL